MKSILHLISSPRKDDAVSIKLGSAIVERLQSKYPDSSVIEVDLTAQGIEHLNDAHLKGFFTPEDQQSIADKQSIAYSNAAINQLMSADFIVIGAPMYNFTIHSSLKAWIDQVARAGKTFRYSESGPEGLVVGKRVYLAVASGGVYSAGDYQPYDFVVPYLSSVLAFLGMTDVSVYRAEGLSVPSLMEAALEKAIAGIQV